MPAVKHRNKGTGRRPKKAPAHLTQLKQELRHFEQAVKRMSPRLRKELGPSIRKGRAARRAEIRKADKRTR